MNVGRKNKRKKKEYRGRRGFDPRMYVTEYRSPEPPAVKSLPGNSIGRPPHRGEIWFTDLGEHPGTSVQSGCRPVLIVSNDIGNERAETLNVLPMTRRLKKPGLPCHTELAPSEISDARQDMEYSMVLAEQITTIGKAQLRNYIGKLDDTVLLTDIDTALSRQLSLAHYETNHKTEEKDINEQQG